MVAVECGEVRLIDCGLLSSDANDVHYAAHELTQQLLAVLSGADSWAIERQGVRMRSYVVQSVLASTLAGMGADVRLISPTRIKKLITGDGRSDKSAVAEAVSEQVGDRDWESPDVSDAVATALSGLREILLVQSDGLEEYERQHHAMRVLRYLNENPEKREQQKLRQRIRYAESPEEPRARRRAHYWKQKAEKELA